MKRFTAIIAATIVTGILACAMLFIGADALFNPNSVPVSDAAPDPATASNIATTADTSSKAQIAQLQNLVSQYQSREKQYQTQINQLNSQVQQFQSVLNDLQRRGIIRIQSDGTVTLPRTGRNGN